MTTEELLYLCKSLFYVREDGLYNKVRRGNRAMPNTKVGCSASSRYPQVKLKGKPYYVHRIVFLMTHTYLPEFIDHIDGNVMNHSPSNLREVTHTENMHNLKCHKVDTTGTYLDKRTGKWLASISIKNKKVHIGSYKIREEAISARDNYQEVTWQDRT